MITLQIGVIELRTTFLELRERLEDFRAAYEDCAASVERSGRLRERRQPLSDRLRARPEPTRTDPLAEVMVDIEGIPPMSLADFLARFREARLEELQQLGGGDPARQEQLERLVALASPEGAVAYIEASRHAGRALCESEVAALTTTFRRRVAPLV